MPAPYDYMSQIQRPDLAKSITSGLMLGQAYGEAVQAQQLREKEAAFKKDFAALFQNPTWETTTALITKYPEYVDKIQAAKKMYGEEKIKGEFDYATKVFRAAQYGNIDIAKKLTQEQIDAARNRGEDVSEYETILKGFDTNPKATAALIGSLAAGLDPEKWKAFADADLARAKIEAETRKTTVEGDVKALEAKYAPARFGAEMGLTQAQIAQANAAIRAQNAAAKKSEAEATKIQAEAEQLGAGVMPLEKRPEAENKLRQEYSNQTKAYQDTKAAYGRVLASEDTAVGDIALIFGYMKMLDPGSVVREGEFATAQNAAGVPDRIVNIYNRALEGERLSPSQRKSFKGQAKKLYGSAKVQESQVRQGITRIAKGYGLNTENIFYSPTEIEPEAPKKEPKETATQIVVQLPNGKSKAFPNQKAADDFKKAAGIP